MRNKWFHAVTADCSIHFFEMQFFGLVLRDQQVARQVISEQPAESRESHRRTTGACQFQSVTTVSNAGSGLW